jgi:UTP--glucose-1-phosphate uridylyltransferase
VGDKQGYLQATVEYALKNPELGREFHAYLKKLLKDETYGDL